MKKFCLHAPLAWDRLLVRHHSTRRKNRRSHKGKCTHWKSQCIDHSWGWRNHRSRLHQYSLKMFCRCIPWLDDSWFLCVFVNRQGEGTGDGEKADRSIEGENRYKTSKTSLTSQEEPTHKLNECTEVHQHRDRSIGVNEEDFFEFRFHDDSFKWLIGDSILMQKSVLCSKLVKKIANCCTNAKEGLMKRQKLARGKPCEALQFCFLFP